MDLAPSPRALDYQARVRAFVRQRVLPLEPQLRQAIEREHRGGDWRRWPVSPAIEALKREARAEGLWNLFLPEAGFGAGLTTLEYAPVAEEMGWSLLAPEVFNCNAPDSGNMELLIKYGSVEQRERWLQPLLAGEIRSAFCMTEPDVASSDPTNLRATARVEGDSVVLDGRKWWATGIGHPRCELLVFMGRTAAVDAPDVPRHRQHGMVLVPRETPGVSVERSNAEPIKKKKSGAGGGGGVAPWCCQEPVPVHRWPPGTAPMLRSSVTWQSKLASQSPFRFRQAVGVEHGGACR